MNKYHFYYKATLNFSNLDVLSYWFPRSSQVDKGAETDSIMWIEHHITMESCVNLRTGRSQNLLPFYAL